MPAHPLDNIPSPKNILSDCPPQLFEVGTPFPILSLTVRKKNALTRRLGDEYKETAAQSAARYQRIAMHIYTQAKKHNVALVLLQDVDTTLMMPLLEKQCPRDWQFVPLEAGAPFICFYDSSRIEIPKCSYDHEAIQTLMIEHNETSSTLHHVNRPNEKDGASYHELLSQRGDAVSRHYVIGDLGIGIAPTNPYIRLNIQTQMPKATQSAFSRGGFTFEGNQLTQLNPSLLYSDLAGEKYPLATELKHDIVPVNPIYYPVCSLGSLQNRNAWVDKRTLLEYQAELQRHDESIEVEHVSTTENYQALSVRFSEKTIGLFNYLQQHFSHESISDDVPADFCVYVPRIPEDAIPKFCQCLDKAIAIADAGQRYIADLEAACFKIENHEAMPRPKHPSETVVALKKLATAIETQKDSMPDQAAYAKLRTEWQEQIVNINGKRTTHGELINDVNQDLLSSVAALVPGSPRRQSVAKIAVDLLEPEPPKNVGAGQGSIQRLLGRLSPKKLRKRPPPSASASAASGSITQRSITINPIAAMRWSPAKAETPNNSPERKPTVSNVPKTTDVKRQLFPQ